MSRTSLYVQGRRLKDGSLYVISVVDLEPAGVLVKAYNQITSAEFFLSPSEDELSEAGLSRKQEDLQKLVESIDLKEISGQTFLSSSLPGVRDAKVVPRGDQAQAFVEGVRAGE
ncbi:unnamed protein product, partial [Heterosigma akashiwo]